MSKPQKTKIKKVNNKVSKQGKSDDDNETNKSNEIDILNERINSLEKENNCLKEQLDIKNDASHVDKIMREYRERGTFLRDFYHYLRLKIKTNITMGSQYFENFLKLPFIYNKTSKEIFGDTIDFVINSDMPVNALKEYYARVLPLKLLKNNMDSVNVKLGNYRLEEVYKIGDWDSKDKECKGIALLFVNDNKELMNLHVRIMALIKTEEIFTIHIAGKKIQFDGTTVFDVISDSASEYVLDNENTLGNEIVNDLELTCSERQEILQEFTKDIKDLIPILGRGYKIVGEGIDIPAIELFQGNGNKDDDKCNITQIDPPYINVKIDCKCFAGKGRYISLMALSGIIKNLNDDSEKDTDVCPFCKTRLKFCYKACPPTRNKILDFGQNDSDELPSEFKCERNYKVNVMSKDAIEYLGADIAQHGRCIHDDDSGTDESDCSEE